MAFIWRSRLDDELQFTWDESESAIFTDKFAQRFPNRLPRGVLAGRPARESAVSTQWQITQDASWDEGDLLRLNDPDNGDFSLRELTATTETALAVAAASVSNGANTRSELDSYLVRNSYAVDSFLANAAGSVSPSLETRWAAASQELFIIQRPAGGASVIFGVHFRLVLGGGATFTGFTDISLSGTESLSLNGTFAETVGSDGAGQSHWRTAVGSDIASLDVSGADADTTLTIEVKDVINETTSTGPHTLSRVSHGARLLDTETGPNAWTVLLGGGDRPFPTVWNITEDMLFATTDVNSTSPTTAHIGQQAALDNTGGNWRIDVSGVGDVQIERIDAPRSEFIVRFLTNRIQTNPAEDT